MSPEVNESSGPFNLQYDPGLEQRVYKQETGREVSTDYTQH